MNQYKPNPKDTKGIVLPQDILALAEKLAENAHDVWARRRMDEGWSFGPERDDRKKKHPCLVPYAELPESEKEYDRNAAMETIKLILLEGYRITPRDSIGGNKPD